METQNVTFLEGKEIAVAAFNKVLTPDGHHAFSFGIAIRDGKNYALILKLTTEDVFITDLVEVTTDEGFKNVEENLKNAGEAKLLAAKDMGELIHIGTLFDMFEQSTGHQYPDKTDLLAELNMLSSGIKGVIMDRMRTDAMDIDDLFAFATSAEDAENSEDEGTSEEEPKIKHLFDPENNNEIKN